MKWNELTDEQKGELLLAKHRGQPIEFKYSWSEDWISIQNCSWEPDVEYRVKPLQYIYWSAEHGFSNARTEHSTHAITIDDAKPIMITL